MSIRINVECMKKCDIMIDVMNWISDEGPEQFRHPKFHQFLQSWKKHEHENKHVHESVEKIK